MRIKIKNEKTGVILLSALVITLVLSLPRVVIVLFLKYNAADVGIQTKASAFDIALKIFYVFIIAVIFLRINTSRRKFRIKRLTIDFSKFYQRMIVNILAFIAVRTLITEFNLHAPRGAVVEKFHEFIFNITSVLEVILCMLAAEIYMLTKTNQEIRLRNEALQKANVEATFEVLKNQVNPHFLFNSLNTINAMIGNSNPAARAFVNNMSQVYRHVLNSANKTVVTLAEEMEFAMAYINMLHERHAGNLKVEVTPDIAATAGLLPPMSLQTLLENAVKHNVVSARQPLIVNIEAKNDSVTVTNVIQEKKIKPPSTGTGLYNLNQRYWYLCKKEIDISKTGSHFSVSLPLLKTNEINVLIKTT